MPFVNKPQCEKCTRYTEEHIKHYWCKCSKTCTLFKGKKEKEIEKMKEYLVEIMIDGEVVESYYMEEMQEVLEMVDIEHLAEVTTDNDYYLECELLTVTVYEDDNRIYEKTYTIDLLNDIRFDL